MRTALDPGVLRTVYDRAAHRYDRWHALATARSDQRGRRLLVRRCVRQGDLVLDAGGGTGLATVLAADAVGPTGSVVLMDLSPGMLGMAEERFASGGLQARVSLEIGDILCMPFPDGRFDVVLSTYSVCPLVDPAGGVKEMYRVLRPGGLLGIAHSSEPRNGVVRWLADRVEDAVWKWPQLSLGCRSVSVLPHLRELGGELVSCRQIGIPLWPFNVIVVQKPDPEASP
jgi:ubiquinone/menaquinone biosynthesis C-methylase UbiE